MSDLEDRVERIEEELGIVSPGHYVTLHGPGLCRTVRVSDIESVSENEGGRAPMWVTLCDSSGGLYVDEIVEAADD